MASKKSDRENDMIYPAPRHSGEGYLCYFPGNSVPCSNCVYIAVVQTLNKKKTLDFMDKTDTM